VTPGPGRPVTNISPPAGAAPMTGVETLMWRLAGHDPRFRATMSLVVRVDGAVPLPGLVSRLGRLCDAVPRLRERVRESRVGAAPVWEPDPLFDVEHQVATMDGPPWEMASAVVALPFDEGRPPWRAVVASSSPDTLILHLHHSYTDGLGGVQLLGELFDLSPAPPVGARRRRRPWWAPPTPAGPPPSVADEISAEVRRAVALWRRAVPWAARTVAAASSDPSGLLERLVEVVGAVRAQAGAATGPASPLLAARSGGVALAPLHLDFGAMRALARSRSVTVNDVFLAGLLDGLERYHSKHGSLVPSVRLAVPISHRGDGDVMRNQIFGTVLRAPLGRLDFDERARLVHEMVVQGRRPPWAPFVDSVADAAASLPGAPRALAAALGSLDVVASNVAGPPVPMWLAGVPVTSMTPVGPRSGAAINVTLLSYCDQAALGVNLDPAAVADGDVLLDCLRAAYEEALGGLGG